MVFNENGTWIVISPDGNITHSGSWELVLLPDGSWVMYCSGTTGAWTVRPGGEEGEFGEPYYDANGNVPVTGDGSTLRLRNC